MPTLLQLNATCNQGSTGKIAENIGLLMKKKGWSVYYAHGARYINKSQLNTYQIQSVWSEYLHILKGLLWDAAGLGTTNETYKLIKYIQQIKPDIIQIHNLHGYYINYKILFEYLNTTSIPIVITMHDCWLFTGHCAHFELKNCEKWKTLCHHCPLISSYPKSLFRDNSKSNFLLKKELISRNRNLHFVAVSKWLERLLRESIYKDHYITTFRNGIDLNIYKPSIPKNQEKFQVLGVGNPWSKEKGLYDIYKLRDLLPSDEYDIVLVGLNQKQLESIPRGIKGILRTNSQQQLVDLYSSSNVFINPTYADTFPTTNLEALACGTPVITYNTGGSPESIDDKTGMVIEKGNIYEIAAGIKQLKREPVSVELCVNRAHLFFDKNECFKHYVNLYESLL